MSAEEDLEVVVGRIDAYDTPSSLMENQGPLL